MHALHVHFTFNCPRLASLVLISERIYSFIELNDKNIFRVCKLIKFRYFNFQGNVRVRKTLQFRNTHNSLDNVKNSV